MVVIEEFVNLTGHELSPSLQYFLDNNHIPSSQKEFVIKFAISCGYLLTANYYIAQLVVDGDIVYSAAADDPFEARRILFRIAPQHLLHKAQLNKWSKKW